MISELDHLQSSRSVAVNDSLSSDSLPAHAMPVREQLLHERNSQIRYQHNARTRLPAERCDVAEFDLAAHVERSRQGPCFVCAHLRRHPEYKDEHIFIDNDVVALLSRYPTLLGYTIVAPCRRRDGKSQAVPAGR